jgi:hypothetical protein
MPQPSGVLIDMRRQFRPGPAAPIGIKPTLTVSAGRCLRGQMKRIGWKEAERILGSRVGDRRNAFFLSEDGQVMTYGTPHADNQSRLVPASDRIEADDR